MSSWTGPEGRFAEILSIGLKDEIEAKLLQTLEIYTSESFPVYPVQFAILDIYREIHGKGAAPGRAFRVFRGWAQTRIISETAMSPLPAHHLHDSDNIFSEKCRHFTQEDRAKLLHYGKIADKNDPMGSVTAVSWLFSSTALRTTPFRSCTPITTSGRDCFHATT